MQHLRGEESGPDQTLSVSRPVSRVYGSLVLVAFLLARIHYTNETRDRLRALIKDFATGRPDRLRAMGFPEGWDQEAIWQADYARDETYARQARLLRDVELLYNADAASHLWHKDDHKARVSRLGYYRKRGAVLSVPGTEAYRYPGFQFDASSGDLHELVIVANRRLLGGNPGTEEQRWQALTWWMTPNPDLPQGGSPQQVLTAGDLTVELLDTLLEKRDDE